MSIESKMKRICAQRDKIHEISKEVNRAEKECDFNKSYLTQCYLDLLAIIDEPEEASSAKEITDAPTQ